MRLASASPVYKITQEVVDSGGGESSSTNYTIRSSMGQLVSGESHSSNYVLYAGFISIPDTDADTVLDNTDNCILIANFNQLDTDSDSQGDLCDLDDDNDGLDDIVEILALGTDPLDEDSDNDGLSDYDEVNVDGDAGSYQVGIDTNPNNWDTDGDGLADDVDPSPLVPQALADGDLAPYGNPDGIINAADLMIAQRIALGIISPTVQDLAHGDLYPAGSPDGVINTSDLILIQQLIFNQP